MCVHLCKTAVHVDIHKQPYRHIHKRITILTFPFQGWLLCHDPSSGCTDYFAGSYAYLDLGNSGAVNFLKNMVADIVSGYPGLDGFQFDDHFSLPNDFASVRSIQTTGLEKIQRGKPGSFSISKPRRISNVSKYRRGREDKQKVYHIKRSAE